MSASEFCPRCQSLQTMEVTISQREEVDSEGNRRTIVTKSYHCVNCGSTLRSEDIGVFEGVGSVREFCPRCQSLRNMEVTVSQREEVDSDGNWRTIVAKSYHCVDCGSTLRSEDIEVVEEAGDSEAEAIEQQATEGETRIDEKHD